MKTIWELKYIDRGMEQYHRVEAEYILEAIQKFSLLHTIESIQSVYRIF